jgi:hypothetical protein
MALPLLKIAPLTQNARVKSFPIGGDESPRLSPLDLGRSTAATDAIIAQAYRQIFFHAFKVDRDPVLESQLRGGQITVKDFIRSLLLSAAYCYRGSFVTTFIAAIATIEWSIRSLAACSGVPSMGIRNASPFRF